MPGELDPSVLISSMEPVLDADEYVFCSVAPEAAIQMAIPSILKFEEKEGTTLIVKRADAERANLSFIYPCKMITLSIDSSLDAVGFLAEITKHLAAAAISMKAVSSFYHEHIFVPTDNGDIALKLLVELSHRKSSFSYNDLVPEFGVSDLKNHSGFILKYFSLSLSMSDLRRVLRFFHSVVLSL